MAKVTPDIIIKTVCEALQLDRDKLLKDRGRFNKKEVGQYAQYTDGGYIAAYLIREKVLIPNGIKRYEKPPTYKQIAYIFKKKSHSAILNWELECKIKLRDKDPKFKAKYEMVVNLLDHNVNIA